MGRWERCNISPTGGRQHVGDGMSSNGVTLGDDQRAKGAVALGGRKLTRSADSSSLVTAISTVAVGWLALLKGKSKVCSGQNRMDTSGPSRDVEQRADG